MMTGNVRFKKLLEPGYIGQVRTRNRIIKTASGTSYVEPTGYIGERAKAYYETLAKGGVGLLIVECSGVEYPDGVHHGQCQFHLDDDKYIPSYSELTQVVHKHGCPIFIQFEHAGPWNPTGLLRPREAKAASTLTKSELPGPVFDAPRGLSLDEVKEYVDIWAKAAERASKAGFDGVEVNGATCHQINTFFSRIWNKREDEYGCQTLENRARFMCEIISETKKRCGKDFAVAALINIVEYGHEKGTTVEEGVQFAKFLQDAGADAIQCRAWSYSPRTELLQPDTLFYPEPPEFLPKDLDWSRKGKGAIVPLVEAVKQVVSIPAFCASRLDPLLGEEFLQQGKLDFVGMTRRLLADPELPNKVAAGRLEDIRPCTGCLHCLDTRVKHIPVQCMVNATLGREGEYTVEPVKKKKKVMVIGGGPAGMEAARIAALRGHEVMLYEKGRQLGGLIPIAAIIRDVELDDRLALIRYLGTQITKEGVAIRLGREVNSQVIDEFKPDVLIIAAGAVHNTFEIPKSQRRNVISSSSLHKRLQFYLRFMGPKVMAWLTKFWMPIGKRVVVIGGTVHGCQLAEFLIKRHRKVTIVHADDVLGEGMSARDQLRLFPWLDKKGVAKLTGVKDERITDKGLIITTKEGEKKILEADTIVVALSLLPNTDIVQNLKGKVPETYTIGSCKEPGLIVDAIADGARIGYTI